MCTWLGSPLANFGYNNQTLTLQIVRTTPARFGRDERTGWGHVTRVAGIGDAAFTTNGPAYVLLVRDGDYELQVQAPGGQATQVEETFARLALNHLH